MTSLLNASTVGSRDEWFDPPGATVETSAPRGIVTFTKDTTVDIRQGSNGLRFIDAITPTRDYDYTRPEWARLAAFLRDLETLLQAPADDTGEHVASGVVRDVAEALAMIVPLVQPGVSVAALGDGGGVAVHWSRGQDTLDIEFDAEGDAVALIVTRLAGETIRQADYLAVMWGDVLHWLYQV